MNNNDNYMLPRNYLSLPMLELRNANLKFKISNLTLGLIVDWVVLTHPGDTSPSFRQSFT